MVPTKDPVKVASGGVGGRRRWDREAARRGAPTGPRVLRLDSLTAPQRRLILALVDAAHAENEETAPAVEKPRAVIAGGRCERRSTP